MDAQTGFTALDSAVFDARARAAFAAAYPETPAILRHQLAEHPLLTLDALAALAAELPDATEVFPTHGFGSFCSATQSDATDSTIGQEKQNNPVLTNSEEAYVEALLGGLDAYPAYYVHMAPANTAGPSAPDLSLPAMAKPDELRRRIEAV